MNVLEPVVIARAFELFAESKGVRAVSRELEIAKGTASRLLRQFEKRRGVPVKCDCGQPLRHRGWCWARFMRSAARQKTMAKMQRRQRMLKRPALAAP